MLACHVVITKAQVLADFENFNLAPGQYLNNAGKSGAFQSGLIELPNFYDPDFDFWSGWAISATTNVTTPGFLNQFSAIAGTGAEHSTAYAVGYMFDPVHARLQPDAIGRNVVGLFITNSTYAYLSMRDGDSFAKRFGGETGTDPDFLLLTIKKFSDGVVSNDSIDFYLADYRFPKAEQDYIVSDWTYISLASLGKVDSVQFILRSSDVGAFGMNTPAYVCIDQVTTDNLSFALDADPLRSAITIGPNPATDMIYLDMAKEGMISLVNLMGQPLLSTHLPSGIHSIPVSHWPRGVYILTYNGQTVTKCLVH